MTTTTEARRAQKAKAEMRRRQRDKESGVIVARIKCHPDDKEALDKLARKLLRKREEVGDVVEPTTPHLPAGRKKGK